MSRELDVLFNPVSVAVYGASNNPSKPSGRPLRYLIDQNYEGKIYPINPKYQEVQGIKCYPDAAGIEGGIDLVIIGVPAGKVLAALEDCAAGGAKAAVILTSGFGEMGEEGRKLQNSLRDFSKQTGIRLLGPNCLGLINFKKKIPLTFTVALEEKNITSGSVALVSQSGAFGSHIFAMARSMGLGFNYWVTTGNEVDIQLNDCLKYLAADASTRVIAGYMEDARDGAKLVEGLDYCMKMEKPVVLLKVGKTEAGSKAASSHTGALAGNAEVYKALFNQKGVIQANDVYELLDFSAIFSQGKKPGDGRVAIVTVSGGAGVYMVDKCEELGLPLAQLSQKTMDRLGQILPAFASTHNPVDVTGQLAGSTAMLKDTLEVCLEDPEVDVVIVYLGMFKESGGILAEQLQQVYQNSEKLMVVTWVEGPHENIKTLRESGLLVFPEPARCIKAVGALNQYIKNAGTVKENRNKDIKVPEVKSSNTVESIKAWLRSEMKGRKALSEYESRRILQAFDIPVVQGDLARTPGEAIKIAEEIGYPVVLKIDSPHILHKSDVGGVVLNVRSEKDVREGYDSIMKSIAKFVGEKTQINGILVEKMERAVAEVLVGCKQDQMFGPTLAFGMGGVFVELFKDISLCVAPLSRHDAIRMVREVKSARILEGLRGAPECDLENIYDVLMKFSHMTLEIKDYVEEIDINPLFVFEKGKCAKAGDALFVLKSEQ